MKRTKKYVAGERLMLKIGGYIPQDNAELYTVLEHRGYWWDAKSGKWLDTPAPSTSAFVSDSGVATGVVKVRVMAHPDDIHKVVHQLKSTNMQIISVSEPYPNRKGAGYRVYVDAIVK